MQGYLTIDKGKAETVLFLRESWNWFMHKPILNGSVSAASFSLLNNSALFLWYFILLIFFVCK